MRTREKDIYFFKKNPDTCFGETFINEICIKLKYISIYIGGK